ncbi:MAG: VCBS repeat-containing protein [Anaerolineae bacterium]|nr:VCBS repeat-containing protein [Anaerolineae bacterium]
MNTQPSSRAAAGKHRSAGGTRWRVFALATIVAVGLLALGGFLTASASATQAGRQGLQPPVPTPNPGFVVDTGGDSGALVTDLVLPGTPFILHWFAPNSDPSRAVAWGDVDNDGDLDLAVANYGKPNRVYINDNGVLVTDPARVWLSDAPFEQGDLTTSLAWGDVNGDGYLDLVVGNGRDCVEKRRSTTCNGGTNRLYLNQQGTLARNASWSSLEQDETTSIALGDINGDGQLDLVVGNAIGYGGGSNRMYLNRGRTFGRSAAWSSSNSDDTTSIALGDIDEDGDLDLVVGNEAGPARLYRNENGRFPSSGAWSTPGKLDIQELALTDTDEDGLLDLVAVTAEERLEVYLGDGRSFENQPVIGPDVVGYPISLAVGDYDGDGRADVAVGKSCALTPDDCSVEVFRIIGGKIEEQPLWTSPDGLTAAGLAWGDIDGDGALDLATGVGFGISQPNRIYRNNSFVLTEGEELLEDRGQSDERYTTYAWGDMDGDGFMDLAAGGPGIAVVVYHNDGGILENAPVWRANSVGDTTSLAWGDVNGDGLLDLAVGNASSCVEDGGAACRSGKNQVYLNSGAILNSAPAWESAESDNTSDLAWGDMDGDGRLDLAVANALDCIENDDETIDCSGQERVYQQTISGTLPLSATWSSDLVDDSTSLAWGDVDNDGDLELAVGNLGGTGQANVLYLNERGILAARPAWTSNEEELTTSIAWGDVDGDGYLDLAVGNAEEASRLYHNNHGQLAAAFTWSALDAGTTSNIALGDIDGDGDLDLVANDQSVLRLYRNEAGALTGASSWSGDLFCGLTSFDECLPLALGDVDNDGDVDVAAGTELFSNQHGERLAASDVPTLFVERPTTTGPADFYSAPEIIAGTRVMTHTVISFTYALSQSLPATVTLIGEYSLNGPGDWQQATGEMAADGQTFVWNTAADGLMGRADNTVFRLRAVTQPATGADHLPNLSQYGAGSATTLPFRAQGTRVQVVSKETGEPLPMAVVYRLPKDEVSGAQPLGTATTQFRTDENGFLQGSGEINLGDQLFALAPVSSKLDTPSSKYTLYFTNLTPTNTGVTGHVVSEPGLQVLEVSKHQPLVTFNLDVSLEWDARNDGTFLADLEQAIKQSSEILFDVTNGQMALGNVRIFQGKANWLESDVVVYANNSMRPRATMGGVLNTTLDDQSRDGQLIPDAFRPGRIRIGPVWDPYGESRAELQQDWWRALAHEYGHYFLYLPDNYLGKDPTKAIVNCVGSFMTTAYDDEYSEFLNDNQWAHASGCDETIAAATTERSDWDTISKFYPMVVTDSLKGPATLPLDVTTLFYRKPVVEGVPTIPARNFDLRNLDDSNNRIAVSQGQAFLIKRQGTKDDLQDDVIVALGQTGNSASIKVRGAAPGDKVCVIDTSSETALVGCNQSISANSPVIRMREYEGWGPDIKIEAVSQLAMVMTVTQAITDVAPVVEVNALIGQSPVISNSVPNVDGYLPVTLVSQQDGPMFALAVTQTVTNPVPSLWIRQVSGPSVAVSVTQPMSAGQPAVVEIYRPAVAISAEQSGLSGLSMGIQLYPGYRIPNRNYTAFSPAGTVTKSEANSDTYRIVLPVDYPVFSGFVRTNAGSREAVSQFFLAKERSPGGGVRWGGVDGYQMGVDNRRGLGPRDRSSQFFERLARQAGKSPDQFPDLGLAFYTGLGPNDAFGLGPNDAYGLGPNDAYGLGPNDAYGLGPNDAYGLGPNDAYGLGPNDAYGLGPNDAYGLGPNDAYGLGPDDLYGLGPNDAYGLGPNDAYGLGPNDAYGLGPNDLYGLGPDDLYGLGPDDAFGLGPDDMFGLGPNDAYGLGPNDLYGLGADLPGLDSAWSTAGAPISSEDGQVAVYNRGNILGDPGTLSLQALAKPPSLPDWLTTVGRAYRFEANGTQERIMAFHYLRREVPPGYEHTFKVYYSPDDGASWERLPTDLYPGQNLATVAANESGIYALAAAVDIPLYNQGWNLFSFPAPYTLTVSNALQSLPADSYGTIFAYDSEDLADPWKVYDPTPGREWMNELSHLAFGESYWISITKAITDPPLLLQVKVAEGQPQTFDASKVSTLVTPLFQRTPPAVYIGAVRNAPAGVAAGATVDALVDGVICGSGDISTAPDGNLRYKVKVEAADVGGKAACGAPNRDVTFSVGGQTVPGSTLWANDKVRQYDLEFPAGG